MGQLLNRAKVNTATTGTGTVTLGAAVAANFQTWASAGAVNAQVYSYLIEDGAAWEVGIGTYTSSGTTLSRTLIESSTGSLLTLTGSATVACVANLADLKLTYYAGSEAAQTYDPGTGTVALNACSITIPPSSKSRVFKVTAYWAGSTSFSASHGVRSGIRLDSTLQGQTVPWVFVTSEGAHCSQGPRFLTVPGDGASHTIDLSVADSGATGNLTFNQRWICAEQVS